MLGRECDHAANNLPNELGLASRISLGHLPHSALSDQFYASIARRVRHAVALRNFGQPRSAFDSALILLDHIAQVLALTKPSSFVR